LDVSILPVESSMELISEAKSGSNYALGQLLQQNYSIVYKYILKASLDCQLAADITQDCMVRVIDKFAYYDPQKSALSTWMITIAKNLLIEEYRRNKRKRGCIEQLELYGENGAADTPYQDQVNDFIMKDEVLSALNKLSEKERIPIILKHARGYSYEEIAKILKIPIGTVKSRISNGLKSFKKELERNEA
jgi:RNA polymerase sigma-70 factor (ECF subfamily)